MDGVISVLKRDGNVEPFVLAKLLNCIGSGFHASGEPQERGSSTSRGLAEAVQAYLQKSRAFTAVPSDHLAELVELVLTQTGYAAAGAAIRHHHCVRERLRRWVKVAHRRAKDGRFVHRQWDKGLIVRRLLEDYQIDAPAARVIAGRVEQLVFNCGLKIVTADLVEEMIKSELLAWGLLPGALAVKRAAVNRGDTRRAITRLDESRESEGDEMPGHELRKTEPRVVDDKREPK